MTKKKNQAEFIKWFGPLLDALRDLGDSGKPKEVSSRITTNLNLPDTVLDETLSPVRTNFIIRLHGLANIWYGKGFWILPNMEHGN